MNARDAFRDTLKELDKFESPTFEIKDFNYFFPKAISRYIDQNYRQFDILQKDVDDLRSVILLDQPVEMNSSGLVALPVDYRHVLHVKVKVKFLKALGKYKVNDTAYFYPERLKSGQKGFRYKNAFGKPNFKRYYYELTGSSFQLVYDSLSVSIPTGSNLWLDYITQNPEPYLNPDKSVDYSQEANNSTLFYNTGNSRNHIYYEIINVCREIFLENIESQRTQVAMQQSAIQ